MQVHVINMRMSQPRHSFLYYCCPLTSQFIHCSSVAVATNQTASNVFQNRASTSLSWMRGRSVPLLTPQIDCQLRLIGVSHTFLQWLEYLSPPANIVLDCGWTTGFYLFFLLCNSRQPASRKKKHQNFTNKSAHPHQPHQPERCKHPHYDLFYIETSRL